MSLIVTILIVVSFIIFFFFRWRRNSILHAQITADEHLKEILEQIKDLKEELIQSETPEKQTLYRTTNEHLVMTYITSLRPNGKVVHSLSISQNKMLLRSAALISQIILAFLQQEEQWNGQIKVSRNNMKMVIFHFFFDLTPEEHANFLAEPLQEIDTILAIKKEHEEKSKEIKTTKVKKAKKAKKET